MSSKSSLYLLSLFVSSCLVFLSIALYSQQSKTALHACSSNATTFYNTVDNTSDAANSHSDSSLLDTYHLMDSLFTLDQYSLPLQSTKAILPVVTESIERLRDRIAAFLSPQPYVLEVVIVCPNAIISRVRTILHDALLPLGPGIDHPDITLRPSHSSSDLLSIVLETASEFTTEWALIVDDTGLADKLYTSWLQTQDISAPSVSFQGQQATLEKKPPTWDKYPANYFRPPFLFPSNLVRSFRESWDISGHASWKDFILYMTMLSSVRNAGPSLVDSSTPSHLPVPVSVPGCHLDKNVSGHWEMILDSPSPVNISDDKQREVHPSPGSRFLFFLPDSKDLQSLLGLVCAMKIPSSKSFPIDIVIYDERDKMFATNDGETHFIEGDGCRIEYEVVTIYSAFPRSTESFRDKWALDYRISVGVVFLLDVNDAIVACLTGHSGKSVFPEATFVKVPPSDLDQVLWMSTLSMRAWKSICFYYSVSVLILTCNLF